ncbi:MAG: Rieske 2Fe-2S domain-containing protein [Candidatus Lustribacter sp.]|jgi:phenylpropionate dioxygenase-like ring-hydroxylating dioxygenase large terminal subunit
MLTEAQNKLLTETDPGTPCGNFMRRYWQPVALSAELELDTPLPVRIMGENLVLFRDVDGKPGLIERRCPHRGMDLSYGRLEPGGLRCLYHGWLFAKTGQCLEQPNEPAASTFKDRIHHRGYPCTEAGGLVLAYMGPGTPPAVPKIPFLLADASHSSVTKRYHECNFVQANDIDPSHLSFLHLLFDSKLANGPSNQYMMQDSAPHTLCEETPFGLRAYSVRTLQNGESYVRLTNFIMPNMQAFVGAPIFNPRARRPNDDDGYSLHWHVPIDDEHHWKYVIHYSAVGPIDHDYQNSMQAGEVDDRLQPIRTAQNRYLQDREEMKTRTFSGVGNSFQDQDRMAVESQGPIYDRTYEHLGVADKPMIEQRKIIFRGIEDVREGRDPMIVRDDGTNPFEELITKSARLAPGVPVQGFWKGTVELVTP